MAQAVARDSVGISSQSSSVAANRACIFALRRPAINQASRCEASAVTLAARIGRAIIRELGNL